MSMNLSVYVGPYLILPKGFDWWDWDSIVVDGRGEAGVDEAFVILIPNRKLDGVTRELSIDKYDEHTATAISEATIGAEKTVFHALAQPIFDYCKTRGIDIRLTWGIVPCWS